MCRQTMMANAQYPTRCAQGCIFSAYRSAMFSDRLSDVFDRLLYPFVWLDWLNCEFISQRLRPLSAKKQVDTSN